MCELFACTGDSLRRKRSLLGRTEENVKRTKHMCLHACKGVGVHCTCEHTRPMSLGFPCLLFWWLGPLLFLFAAGLPLLTQQEPLGPGTAPVLTAPAPPRAPRGPRESGARAWGRLCGRQHRAPYTDWTPARSRFQRQIDVSLPRFLPPPLSKSIKNTDSIPKEK